jgi:hypothetical protein
MFRHNFIQIKKSPTAIVSGLLAAWLLSRLVWWFTDLALIQWNQGTAWMYSEIVFNTLFAVLFGVLVAATVYKRQYMSQFNSANSATGLVGSFLGTLVAGCPSCTITLASYMGLASLIGVLPRWGVELKLIGLGLMIWSIYQSVTKIHQCDITSTQKGK